MKKFLTDYGPVEFESLDSALDATAAWLRFAGYAAISQHSPVFDFDCSYLW
jgi:uncharacterized protein with PIN domain